jgi:hypothetical protein
VTLQRLAEEHAATLHVALGRGSCRLCLLEVPNTALAQTPREPQLAIRVPLSLVLSDEVPGCCPAALACQPLRDALHELRAEEETDRWELRLAAMLLWAVRQRPESPVGSFWGRWGGAGGPGCLSRSIESASRGRVA